VQSVAGIIWQYLAQLACLQVINNVLVVSDMAFHTTNILDHVCLDLLRPVCIFERVHAVMILIPSCTDGGHHSRAAVALQAVFEQPAQRPGTRSPDPLRSIMVSLFQHSCKGDRRLYRIYPMRGTAVSYAQESKPVSTLLQ